MTYCMHKNTHADICMQNIFKNYMFLVILLVHIQYTYDLQQAFVSYLRTSKATQIFDSNSTFGSDKVEWERY